MTIGKMTSVAVTGPAQVKIAWDDGFSAPIDLAGTIAAHAALTPLRTPKDFAKAHLSQDGWALEWPSGIDFGAPQLRRWADEQAGELMAAPDFRAWMTKHRLTQDAAAQALGLSRRMIAYYLSGEKPIPKTVMLATEGYAARAAAA